MRCQLPKLLYLISILPSLRIPLTSCHANHWETQLNSLTVQNKFLGIITLKQQYPLWKRLTCGLPVKQLSFLLWAEYDTFLTIMNLAWWKIIVSPAWPLCHSNQPTTNHILTGCPTALDQGRYTWCHDSVLQVFVHGLQKNIPPHLCWSLWSLNWLGLVCQALSLQACHCLQVDLI